MGGGTLDQLIFWLVVAGRLLLPLLIFRYPLPAIIGCLVLDGIDQTLFQTLTGLDLTHYQSWDKALDVYYLSLAYVAVLRNWTSAPVVLIARCLYFYRMVGTAAFELSGGVHRWLLLVFPNTFEYFFICYELVRLRWNPARRSARFWLWAAALIWVVIKIPQETWIHVLQWDFTDTVQDVWWVGPAVVLALVALGLVLWFVVRPRLAPPDHDWQWRADPAHPVAAADAGDRSTPVRSLFHARLVEKIAIVALLSMIMASIVPSVTATNRQVLTSVAALIIINSAVGLTTRRRTVSSLSITFLVEYALNLGVVVLAAWLVPNHHVFFLTAGSFFLLLLTLIVILYDRIRPGSPTPTVRAQPVGA